MPDPPRCLIVPAAGLGTRMKIVYPWLPKEMLPLGGEPAIHYALQEARHAGIEHVIVILNAGKQIVRRYLQQQELRVTVLYQAELSGEADAIALAQPLADGGSVAVLYPDNIYAPGPGAIRMLNEVHTERQSDVVGLSLVTAENEATVGNSGRVDLEPVDGAVYRILNFLPKGPGSFQRRFDTELRTCGMMITGPHLFDAIRRARPRSREGEFTDEPVRRLLLQERGLLGLRFPGTVFDIGNPNGYRRCLEQFE